MKTKYMAIFLLQVSVRSREQLQKKEDPNDSTIAPAWINSMYPTQSMYEDSLLKPCDLAR